MRDPGLRHGDNSPRHRQICVLSQIHARERTCWTPPGGLLKRACPATDKYTANILAEPVEQCGRGPARASRRFAAARGLLECLSAMSLSEANEAIPHRRWAGLKAEWAGWNDTRPARWRV